MATMTNDEPTPVIPHLTSEFFTWLWWKSVESGGSLTVGGAREDNPVGRIDLWVDDRLAFRIPGDKKVSAVLTGEQAAESLEAKAAMYGGKVLNEVRLRIRRDEREFSVTLSGPEMDLKRMSFPQELKETEEEAIYDRMFLYDELMFIVSGLYRDFGRLRCSDEWASDVVPQIREWIQGRDS